VFAADLENRVVAPDPYLSKEEVTQLRSLLIERGRAILESGQDAVQELTVEREHEADEVDVASTEAERESKLRIAGRERQMLNKISYALNRMEQGEYGECESCAEPIGFKRQLARPVATRCIDCKTREEQLERKRRAF